MSKGGFLYIGGLLFDFFLKILYNICMKVKYKINLEGSMNIPNDKIKDLEDFINSGNTSVLITSVYGEDENVSLKIDKNKNLTFENFCDIIK